MFSGFVGTCADSTAGVIPAEGSRVPIGLTLAALGASSVCNIVVHLTFAVAYDKILTTDSILLDVTSECHNNCGTCLVLAPFRRSKPSWGLPLNQLGVVCSDAV